MKIVVCEVDEAHVDTSSLAGSSSRWMREIDA